MSTIAAAIKGWFTGEEIVRNLVVAIAIGPIALFIVGAVSVANTKALIEAESAVDHARDDGIWLIGCHSPRRQRRRPKTPMRSYA